MFSNKNVGLSGLEMLILSLLLEKGASESYGLDLVERSEGQLKKGSIYVTLGRMEDKGFISSRKEELRPGARGLPRRLYRITALGQSMVNKELKKHSKLQRLVLGASL